jgi:hypothetical protein
MPECPNQKHSLTRCEQLGVVNWKGKVESTQWVLYFAEHLEPMQLPILLADEVALVVAELEPGLGELVQVLGKRSQAPTLVEIIPSVPHQ